MNVQFFSRKEIETVIAEGNFPENTAVISFCDSGMVDEGIGYAICFDRIINVSGDSNLCFRPLSPRMEAGMSIVRKKYKVLSKAIEKFLERIRDEI